MSLKNAKGLYFLKALNEKQKIKRLICIEFKKKNSDYWTSRGPLRNLRHNLHLFLDNIEPRKEKKNLSLGKTVLKIWSLIGRKMT